MAERRKSYRISRKAILDGRDSRHKASFGPSRADLFMGSKDLKEHPIIRVLPQLKARGRHGIELYYFSEGGHWVDAPNEQDSNTHRERPTCFEYLRNEQPAFYAHLLNNTEFTEETARCFFCEILKEYEGQEDELPLDPKFGKPTFKLDITHSIPVLLPQDEYAQDDEHTVKILAARISVIQGLDAELEDNWPDLLDPDQGTWVKVWLESNSYHVSPQRKMTGKVWFKDWEKKMPDMEALCPNLWPYEKQVQHFEATWPHLISPPVRRPPKREPPKQRRGSAQSQLRSTKKKAVKKTTRRRR